MGTHRYKTDLLHLASFWILNMCWILLVHMSFLVTGMVVQLVNIQIIITPLQKLTQLNYKYLTFYLHASSSPCRGGLLKIGDSAPVQFHCSLLNCHAHSALTIPSARTSIDMAAGTSMQIFCCSTFSPAVLRHKISCRFGILANGLVCWAAHAHSKLLKERSTVVLQTRGSMLDHITKILTKGTVTILPSDVVPAQRLPAFW